MKKAVLKKILSGVLAVAIIVSLAACADNKAGNASTALDPDSPTAITVWNYYNGDQLTAFEALVEEFNSTFGIEKGIVVTTVSQGNINTLADSLLDSVNGKAGAQEIPNLASVYAETAYILDQAGCLVPLDKYFTQEELDGYVPGFIEEGRFNSNNDLLLFPILKSTEIFTANATDWEPFEADTGISLESIRTKEDLTAAAEAYYKWSDAQTPDIAEDGKALYGRDSISNYIYLGCHQLGKDMFTVENGAVTVNLDRDAFKTLWDNYYIPYINGYFGAYAKFRSEDAKTGKILCLTSSSSSIGYIPTEVTLEDDSKHPIELYESEDMLFKDATVSTTVQQGASYCVLTGTEAQQEASVEFLKWFSAPEQNLQFAIASGYSPVSVAANDTQAIHDAYTDASPKGQIILEALDISAKSFSEKEAFAQKPFGGSKDVRSYFDSALQEICDTDRAAVAAAIAAGATREEASAKYMTDEYFDQWFAQVSEHIDSLVK